MLFDSLVIGQIIPNNPAARVRGPKYSAKKGKTPTLNPDESRQLFDAMAMSHHIGLRDRAFIGIKVYTFARVSAVIPMKVEGLYQSGVKWKVRFHEKCGKHPEAFAHRIPTRIYQCRRQSRNKEDSAHPNHGGNIS